MSLKNKIQFIKLIFLLILNVIIASPTIYYAKINSTIHFDCNRKMNLTINNQSLTYCYSTYSFKNQNHDMIILNNYLNLKYKITNDNKLVISNIEPSDTGFYSCSSSNCSDMNSDLIDYFLEVVGMHSLQVCFHLINIFNFLRSR